MIYKIKRAGNVIAEVEPEGKRSLKIMDVNTVEMSFSLPKAVKFAIGDYVDVFGARYKIKAPDLPDVDKVSSKRHDYSILFKSKGYDLVEASFMGPDANNELTEADFTAMGNAETFIDLLLLNANRYQSGWQKGTVDDTAFKNMAFSNENCLSVLSTLATTYNIEWWIEGQTIHLTKKGFVEPVTLQYGKGNGLYKISRKTQTDKNIVTRLYVYGSDRNLPTDYKSYSKRLKIPALIGNVDKYGPIEKSVTFDDIKPERLGTVTGVIDKFTFTDTGMDFDVEAQLLPGVKAKVQFNTGQLAGYSFEIEKYTAATNTFTILTNQDEKALVLPSDLFMPQVGDQYVLIDLNMPQSYIDNAHERLKVKGQEYLLENSEPLVVYSIEPDKLNFKKRALRLTLGNYIKVIDADFDLNSNIRITAITQNLQNEFDYTANLQQVVSISQALRSYENYQQLLTAIRLNRLTDIAKSRMSWLMAEELRRQIYDPDGFFDLGNIKPLSIQTSMLSTGIKSQQFALQGVVCDPNFEGTPNRFYSSNGMLTHFTVSSTPVSWVLQGQLITGLVASQVYYIYVRCSKNDNTAQVVLSVPVIGTEEVTDYYHFWVGVLHSVIDGVRGISLTYGQTTINGRFINTGRVQGNGIYLDLDSGEMNGKVTFAAGSNGYDNIADKPNLDVFALNSYVDTIKDDLQTQIDGSITAWFYEYEPTLTNAPANTWLTNGERDKHLGDLFYWNAKGYAYRFSRSATTNEYSWVAISDADVIKALDAAQKAQDTADGKRRTFIVQPYTPYDAGDLWTDGKHLYRCVSGRQSGAFTLNDWGFATEYALSAYVDTIKDELQKQIDGQITSWFYDYDPNTPNTTPSNDWNDDATRNKHLGDLFYWSSKGYAYRYIFANGNYSWTKIADTDVVLALQTAQTAQDTADGKRRTFIVQPVTPYDAGDLWTDGSNLYKCAAGRQTGAFNRADWDNATTYDNTVTTINGGIVTTGTVNLGNASGQNAGITGNGTSPESIRIWAGASFDNRAFAPFRVQDNGIVVMTQAIITGQINATSGRIANWTIDNTGLKHEGDDDASIIQIKTFANGKTAEARIGTNMLPAGLGNLVGYFVNDEVGQITNGAIYARASGATQNNIAIEADGDFRQQNGRIVINGRAAYSGDRDVREGGGFVKYTFDNGILVNIGT
jgi:hypothetical protein